MTKLIVLALIVGGVGFFISTLKGKEVNQERIVRAYDILFVG
jgi:hypothetical protein